MSCIAAIDLGTTTARVGLFDETGTRLSGARSTLVTTHPFAGAVEQDPQRFVDVAVELIHAVLADARLGASAVAALGIANQRATVVAWDSATGAPLRPALGWQDTRTAARCAELVAQGIPVTTSASCSKLEWLMMNDREVRTAADQGTLRLGTVDTWLTWALSGGAAHITDPSNAGATGLYDLRSGDWGDGALELFAVPREPLAAVTDSDAVAAVTSADLVGAEIPLTARVGDQQAACIAHGLRAGEAKLTLGTSAMLDLALGPTAAPAPDGCYTLPMARRGGHDEFMVEGSVQTAGAAMEWLVRIGILESVDRIDGLARAGGSGVAFVPALAGLGSPMQDPDARAVLTGLGLDTGPAEIVRAALDGIAARVADLTDAMDVEGELRVDGGLSRSGYALQAIADTTGLRIRPAADPETTLRGAAMLAAASPDVGFGPIPPAESGAPLEPTTTEAERQARRARHDELLAITGAPSAARD